MKSVNNNKLLLELFAPYLVVRPPVMTANNSRKRPEVNGIHCFIRKNNGSNDSRFSNCLFIFFTLF